MEKDMTEKETYYMNLKMEMALLKITMIIMKIYYLKVNIKMEKKMEKEYYLVNMV